MSGSMTGGVDASIPLQARAPQSNPLQQVGEFANTLNAINQTKLFPGQQQLQQQAIQGGNVTLSQHINQAVNQGLTPLLAMPAGTITHKAFTDAMGAIEARGIPTSGPINQYLAMTPTGDGPEFDQKVRSIITSQAMTAPESSVGAVTGSPDMVNKGLEAQPGIRPGPGAPGFGSFDPRGSPQQIYPSRAELAGRITGPPNPITGAPRQMPLAAGTPPELSGINLGPGRPGGTAAGLPSAIVGPHAQTEAPGLVETGLGPAVAAQKTNTGGQSATAFSNVSQEAQHAQEQNALLSNMQNDLKNFTSGPGSHTSNDLEKVIQGWVPGLSNTYKTKIAAQESFDKLSNQLVTTAEPGSDARQGVLQGANPSSVQSPEGVDFIIRQLQGVNDYKTARANLAASPGVDRSDYPTWQSKTGGALDPRVFQFARLNGEQKRIYYAGLPPGERAAFKQKYLAAQGAGFYGVNNGAQ